MLSEFLATHRDELLARVRQRVVDRNTPNGAELDLTYGLPVFLDQLRSVLRRAASERGLGHPELERTAAHHGRDLFQRGLSVAQVVHGYGDFCQVITGLAAEKNASISVADFQTLNLCLDDAIAGAVTEFGRQRERALVVERTERSGELAHELRNHLNTAMLAFSSIRKGIVGVGGSSGAILERSLTGLQMLIDRSFANARLDVGLHQIERLLIREVIEEVQIGASLSAEARGLTLRVDSVDDQAVVEADGRILAAAITNLLQNAFKFTRTGSQVILSVRCTETRVTIDVADECGGLPPGRRESLLQPFVQRGGDRSGLGLGLSICVRAMQSMDGQLHVRDVPGHGCVFTIDLPRQAREPATLSPPSRVY
ncbi:MAG: HAMP domain-containing sensor histidine kinase [Polyangiaceae bacterium]